VVFSLVNGSYVMTSLAFPQVYVRQREAVIADCAKKAPEPCWGEIVHWIDSLAVGDWDTAKSWLKDEELRKVFDKRTPAMKKALAALGSKQRPVDVTPKK
jgi:hypothetical protein